MLDCVQQPRFLLPNDLIQLGSPHACLLEILERLSCVYALVLAGIAKRAGVGMLLWVV